VLRDDRLFGMSTPEGVDPEYDAARVRLGRATRRLSHAVIGRESSLGDIEAATREIEGVIARLESAPPRVRDLSQYGQSLKLDVPEGGVLPSHIGRPGSGPGSPLGLDMTVTRAGQGIEARFRFDSAHEGPPQRGHGGVIALAFDDALGFVINLHQVVAYTGQLSIRYSAGAPMHTPLVIAARLERKEGRKLFVESELREDRPDSPLIATCSAIFIEMSGHPGITASST
jgi:acyl-coenzyme A thioesterase PaaI-like protein